MLADSDRVSSADHKHQDNPLNERPNPRTAGGEDADADDAVVSPTHS
eukprot:SAG22_NODE_16540_length_323_cov_0.758929_1_plen_46_part_10